MKPAAALALSLALLATAAPCLGQSRDQPGDHRGREAQRPPPHEERREPDRRGGYPEARGAYVQPRAAYPEPRAAYPQARGGYGEPYAAPPPVARGGPDSLGADWGGQQDEARAAVRQGRYVGLSRVIGSIRQRTPGRQLDAGLEQWGGRAVYRVRWAAPDGHRIDYIVDAQSGAILHVDGG